MFQRKVPNKKNHLARRFHYTRKKGKWKPKKNFISQEEGDQFIRKHRMVGYVTYVCPLCGNWHIGKRVDK